MFEITTFHSWGRERLAHDFKSVENALNWISSHIGEIIHAEEDEDNADHWDAVTKNGNVYSIEPM